VQVATQCLATAGYRLQAAESDWVVDGTRSAADCAMLRALIDGMAQAACEQCPAHAAPIDAWCARRLATLDTTCLRVSHIDLLGWPLANG
jgi:hypothetical protein